MGPIALISYQSHFFTCSIPLAYRYLSCYGAIKVAHDFYDVMHTQPMADMVQSMATYCHRKAAENESRASELALLSDSRLDEVKGGHL